MSEKCFWCGREGKYQSKNGNWRCEQNISMCPEIKEKNRISKFGKKRSESTIEKIRISKLGKSRIPFSDNTKRKMSDSRKGVSFSDSHKINLSRSLKGKLVGIKNGMFGKKHTVKSKQIISEKTLKCVKENNGKGAFYGKKHKEESKEKMSKSHKKLFEDPFFVEEFKKNIFNDNKISIPNKQEIIIINLLNEIFPGKYKFVGDFKIWIGGKNPDFINEIDKKLIEFFGKNWHKKEDEKQRIDHFKKYGYKTLVIWDYELKDMNNVKDKIKNFSEGCVS
jgi:hypothetical protein